jgi:hypothetical protein
MSTAAARQPVCIDLTGVDSSPERSIDSPVGHEAPEAESERNDTRWMERYTSEVVDTPMIASDQAKGNAAATAVPATKAAATKAAATKHKDDSQAVNNIYYREDDDDQNGDDNHEDHIDSDIERSGAEDMSTKDGDTEAAADDVVDECASPESSYSIGDQIIINGKVFELNTWGSLKTRQQEILDQYMSRRILGASTDVDENDCEQEHDHDHGQGNGYINRGRHARGNNASNGAQDTNDGKGETPAASVATTAKAAEATATNDNNHTASQDNNHNNDSKNDKDDNQDEDNNETEILTNVLQLDINDWALLQQNRSLVSDNTSRTSARRKRSKSDIPHHVNDTVHKAKYIDEINMYTKLLNLELCEVIMVQRLHGTTPPATITQSTTPIWHRFYPHSQLPMLEFAGVADAGPLRCMYKSVVCMEVVQRCSSVSSLRQQALALEDDTTTRPQRLRIYLYDDYAEVVNEVIDHLPTSNTKMYLQLEGIPAHCIVPYARVDVDWFDRHNMSPYCLCIGSLSLNLIGSDFVRLDSVDMNMRFGWDVRKEDMVEWRIVNTVGDGSSTTIEDMTVTDKVISKGLMRAEQVEKERLLTQLVSLWEDVRLGRQTDGRTKTRRAAAAGEMATANGGALTLEGARETEVGEGDAESGDVVDSACDSVDNNSIDAVDDVCWLSLPTQPGQSTSQDGAAAVATTAATAAASSASKPSGKLVCGSNHARQDESGARSVYDVVAPFTAQAQKGNNGLNCVNIANGAKVGGISTNAITSTDTATMSIQRKTITASNIGGTIVGRNVMVSGNQQSIPALAHERGRGCKRKASDTSQAFVIAKKSNSAHSYTTLVSCV